MTLFVDMMPMNCRAWANISICDQMLT